MMLSLVIPCYNEALSLPGLIENCESLISDQVEIILVDNGSGDGTPEILRAYANNLTGLRSVRLDINNGYGSGIIAGLEVAKGEVLGWTHADMQTDPKDVLAALEIYQKSSNSSDLFVKGKRMGRPIMDQIFTIGMSIFET